MHRWWEDTNRRQIGARPGPSDVFTAVRIQAFNTIIMLARKYARPRYTEPMYKTMRLA
jgi:hypothetical protein